MGIVFADGFDQHLAVADIIAKCGGGSSPIRQLTGARTGGQCCRLGAFSNLIRMVPPDTTYGVSMAIKLIDAPNGEHPLLVFGSSDPSIGLFINPSGVLRAFRLAGSNANSIGTGTLLGTASETLIVGAWDHVEVKVVIHPSAGSVSIRKNGAPIMTVTGVDTLNDTAPTTATPVTSVRLGYTINTSGASFDVDDLVIWNSLGASNNDWLGDCKVELLLPSGNGANSGLTGSDGNSIDNYLLVDETLASAVDYVGSAVAGIKDTYTLTNLIAATGTIKAIQAIPYVAKSDAGVRSCCAVYRHATIDYDGPDLALSTAYRAVPQVQELNPGTGLAWTVADVNALEAGIKVRP